ncbi:MAG TPA: hypothetical protein VJP85_00255 [Candidatus Baltobacteraceae bacterium]|nr:hypothetical protein [Candidatus Baltobacteraceae bacterium]
MTRRTFVAALLALVLGFALAGAARAFSPWLQMTTPCDDAPSAVAIGGGKIVVACSGDSHLHYKDFP